MTVKLVRPNGSPPPKPAPEDGHHQVTVDEVLDTVRTGLDDAAKEFAVPRAHRRGGKEGK